MLKVFLQCSVNEAPTVGHVALGKGSLDPLSTQDYVCPYLCAQIRIGQRLAERQLVEGMGWKELACKQ